MAIAAFIGFIIIIIDYFTPHGTIAQSWGALIVVISSALMVIASAWIAFGTLPRCLLILFEVLIILDILGSGVCAYFLEADAVLVFMVVALVGWVWHLTSDRPRISEG
jgi:hypothetical protein